jgi:hypothetical protein
MKHHHATRQTVNFLAVLLLFLCSALPFSAARENAKSPAAPITIDLLAGTWTATLSGVTGCGVSTLVTTFKLDTTGNGTQSSSLLHTAGCGDQNLSGLSVQIQSFNGHGTGFIAFGCGSGCGFGFNMQVNSGKQVFNLGAQPVSGNYLAGTAVRRP